MTTRLASLALALLLTACRDDPDALRGDVQIVVAHEGEMMQAATRRLVRHGVAALPPIEAALHTADESGREHLVYALREIGEAEAIPLLRHIALHDAAEGVRREALLTLEQWAAAKDQEARARRARAAVREIQERPG
ncbi:MAG TPA: HEAT repeat domain-containing protein [Polyangia bacterium]|jgi:HEAT repeat protein|nr:HEAT repeat domain-containing protein [Polyangia bacterium]